MFEFLKISKLGSALKSQGPIEAAYSAVLELAQIGNAKSIELLIDSLGRRDGVSRSAARELGRLGDARAIQPLAGLLGDPEVSQSAAEALIQLRAVDALAEALKQEKPAARKAAAAALGQLADPRGVDPLVQVVQTDPEYSVRTAAAAALGQLKDHRAIWVLVATLKLRDETTPERQSELEQLRHATSIALRKIGDPFAGKAAAGKTPELPPEKPAEIEGIQIHPKLDGDLSLLAHSELVSVLKELLASSEEISWANLENRQPLLPAWFSSYEQRRKAADMIGAELNRRGGSALMKKVLEEDLAGNAAIDHWWKELAA